MLHRKDQILGTLFAFLLLAQGRILAPLVRSKDPSLVIPGHYIVVLADEANGDGDMDPLVLEHEVWLTSLIGLRDQEKSHIKHKFNIDGLAGYTGKFSDPIVDEIRRRPDVKYVEPDQIVYANDMIGGESRISKYRQALMRGSEAQKGLLMGQTKSHKHDSNMEKIGLQFDAPWGLSRVSHLRMPLDLSKYQYPRSAGKGVDVYVIDTGVNVNHADFGGRARWGITIPSEDLDIDGNGHGTHCAGIIASRTYGIAKKAHVVAVKVLRTNGFGTNADVIKGVEWTIREARRGAAKGRRAVANMSLGGGKSFTLETIVNRAVKGGVHFAVAAGNDNEDACDYSPAAADGPITVGASTSRDEMAFFSNHGACVDIFAPGLDITSTWIGSKRATNTISGTSMASPHVAGALALYLGEYDLQPKELKNLIVEHSSMELLEGLPFDTANRLLCTRSLLESLAD